MCKTRNGQDCKVFKLWIPRSQVAHVVAMVESYEALGVLRIVEPRKAIALAYVSPSFLEEFLSLMEDLVEDGISIKIVQHPENTD